ncbi:amidohydrolase family protein [Sphingomonas nostoxanthinifaciens]|uniref:amidohydrolase family protein n=1 Tax=Sphingomonas nostoxanthinifaciens TaxID=2872652 RepID=UPI001CC1C263|nr:amidohydrolase family protein [Sphingomonas nostoxanthinifaciens]UAK23458.1 amidohydrolase family protein [Sphingomonas nostoxanthinifaciens]
MRVKQVGTLFSCALLSVCGTARAAAPAPRLTIANVTVIDGTGAAPQPNMSVTVENGRIVSIGRTAGRPAKSARVIDGTGRFLLPGFIDSNAHLTVYGQPSRRDTSAKYGDRNEELALEVAQRSLKAGVTTLIDSYGVLPPSIVVRDKINRGELTGSRLLLAGNILGWGGTFSLTFSLTKPSDLSVFQEKWNDLMTQGMGEEIMDMTPDELRVAMDHYLDKGVDVVKYGGTSHFLRPSLIGFSPAQQAVIVEEAHKRHVPVQTHATSPEGLRLAVEAGIDLIQHPELNSRDLPDPLVKEIVDRGTLCGMRSNLFTGDVRTAHLARRAAAEAAITKMGPPETDAEKWRRYDMVEEMDDIQYRNAKKLIAAGCRVTPATDSYLGDAPEFRRVPKTDEAEPGMGTIRAIEGLVELGMTPMQAIVAATKNGAASAYRSQDLGTVEPGKIADLVLIDADPLADIRNIEKVDAVIAQGRTVDLAALPEHPLFYRKPAGAAQ